MNRLRKDATDETEGREGTGMVVAREETKRLGWSSSRIVINHYYYYGSLKKRRKQEGTLTHVGKSKGEFERFVTAKRKKEAASPTAPAEASLRQRLHHSFSELATT